MSRPADLSLEAVPTVFVTVGTDHHRFDRLVGWADRWAADRQDVRCIVQYGTSGAPEHAEGFAYLAKPDLQVAMREAVAVVCHGGPATIAEARQMGHIPIIVPRRAGHDEHVDDHQYRFSLHVSEEKWGVVAGDEAELRELLDHAIANPAALVVDRDTSRADSAVNRFASLVEAMRSPGRATRVMYIGGFGRSGSTLLSLLAGSLPGCVSVGELVFVWERGVLLDNVCGCGRRFSECEFWSAVGQVAFGGWDRVDIQHALALHKTVDRNRNLALLVTPGLSSRYNAALREWCDDYLVPLYDAIAEVSGAEVIVDSSKHVSYAFVLRHVANLDLRVVQLVRDPRGVAHSWSKQKVRPEAHDGELMPEYSPARSTAWWLYANTALRLLPSIGVENEVVRYEDLVADPARVLHQLARYAETPGADDADFDFIRGHDVTLARAHTVSGNPMRFESMSVRVENDTSWVHEMSRRDQRVVSSIAAFLPDRELRRASRQVPAFEPVGAGETADRDPDRPWPSVSAVISTRDRPELLDRAIESIAEQDYPGELEIVVVFDQSPVDEALAGERHGRRVRTTSNTRAPGLPGGRNSGINVATGELVAFCDDDDEWLKNKLTTQVAVLENHPESAVATSGILVQYGTSEVAREPDRATVTFEDLLKSRVSWVHPSTLLVRRDRLCNEIGAVNEEIPGGYGEDYEWLLRAAQNAPIVVAAPCLTRVNWHPASYFEARWRTIIEALEWLLKEYPSFESEPHGLARIEGQIAFAHAAAGDRGSAVRWALRSMKHHPTEPRAALAVAVACGVPADRVLARLHHRGKGI